MKKLTALLLALAMCFALAACGGNGNGNQTDEGGETDIPDDDTPTGDLPDQPGDGGEVDIDDGDTPTGNLPQTGTTSSSAVLRAVSGVFLCLAVVFGCATVVLFRKEREQG